MRNRDVLTGVRIFIASKLASPVARVKATSHPRFSTSFSKKESTVMNGRVPRQIRYWLVVKYIKPDNRLTNA